jgi:hypothetical protein
MVQDIAKQLGQQIMLSDLIGAFQCLVFMQSWLTGNISRV